MQTFLRFDVFLTASKVWQRDGRGLACDAADRAENSMVRRFDIETVRV